jgi:hypothetical protein
VPHVRPTNVGRKSRAEPLKRFGRSGYGCSLREPVTFSEPSQSRTRGCPTSRSFFARCGILRTSTFICQECPRLVPETWALSIPITAINGSATLPFVIPSGAEEPAVQRNPPESRRSSFRNPIGNAVFPSNTKSAKASAITGANLKPWPENPAAKTTFLNSGW